MRKPDFENILMVLSREKPHRPTLFEFSINADILCRAEPTALESPSRAALAWERLGYDFMFIWAGLTFVYGKHHEGKSFSLNEGAMISSWEDFETYPWPIFETLDYSPLDQLRLPAGMKAMAVGPNGILENVVRLVGYDALCLMTYDNPELVQAIFDRVAELEYRHYSRLLESDCIGGCLINDDWGFAQGPMLTPEDMRKYVVPHTRRLVQLTHEAGRPAFQHSCGNVFDCGLIEDVIDVCKFDGRHSYEDNTLPVEEAYERYGHRIAILGGIDVDFLCRRTPEEIRRRSLAMLERSAERGSYALGSGNSIPEYVPPENFFAMIGSATGIRYDF